MIAADKPPLTEAYLAHISFKPWSAYTKADYTPEQWHKACLIHQHTGAPTSKDQCKLPVRTPLGALNKNGIQAAKAALNGARGGVDATPAEKAKAKTQLDELSKQLEKNVPAFLAKHSDMSMDDVLEHFGTKGMHWGVRKDRGNRPRLLPGARTSMAVGRKIGNKINAARTPDPNKPKMSTGKKVAIAATAATGAAAVAMLLTRSGRSTIRSIAERAVSDRSGSRSMRRAQARTRSSLFKPGSVTDPFSSSFGDFGRRSQRISEQTFARHGQTKVSDISQSEWKSRVSSVLKDMKNANAEQDAYMRSIGLGAAVNKG